MAQCEPRQGRSKLMSLRMRIGQILTAYVGVAILCSATFYAPLLHEHPAGQLGEKAVIHAHLPEPEEAPPNDQPSIGYHHSHAKAIWLDGFTTTTPPHSPELVATVTVGFVMPDAQHKRRDDVSSYVPRAHSPPSLDRSAPRSPPA
jgi:hypothetical protein